MGDLMRSSTRFWKVGDLEPPIREGLVDGDGEIIDLANCTVEFLYRPVDTTGQLVTSDADIVDADSGIVEFVPLITDTAVAGTYEYWWVVTDAGGDPRTIPQDGANMFIVEEAPS